MAEIVCIIGNKGGTGKTTLSHMVCQGMGLLGQRSACILTDTSREPLAPEGRRYVTADARNAEALAKVVVKLRSMDDWLGVIDGGGNREDVDRQLYGVADIVLLPFRESHEDIRTVVRDLDRFPRAYAVPTQWPTNAWQRHAADRSVAQLMSDYRHRILRPVSALSSSKLLLQRQVPDALPTALANACRAVAGQVMDLLELEYSLQAPEEGPVASGETRAIARYGAHAHGH